MSKFFFYIYRKFINSLDLNNKNGEKKLVEKNNQYFKLLTNNWSNKEIYHSKMQISELNKNKNKKKRLPTPFLKWAGGKRQLLPQMQKYFPSNFNQYIEPFVGGGAVFLFLYNEGFLKNKTFLIDTNEDLINTYKVVKNNVEDLIDDLKIHVNDKDYYYSVREKDRNQEIYNKMTFIEKASRIIYMNKCCYNGLYRVNSKGQFNVPFGKYKNPKFCDGENLRSVSLALKNVELVHGSFEKVLNFAKKDDFIYFDPPYHPLSATSSFTSYTKDDFGMKYQEKLFEIFQELDKRRCKLMLSNSFSDFIRGLYEDYNKIELKATRAINCDATKRGKIKEILIVNDF